ncbi:MAG: hypothetical protein C7B46_20610 [Sulfobacillus benefaciens]|uniref:Uncharacterized protein n=1 Tax=Sulfobacillus benefaciens TaxID=453960 RepID=A0A2T2WTC4_9FIRM|nr:MAG: hypothetical protein C7B46_20610 [Sulfobacillus benefaciens]
MAFRQIPANWCSAVSIRFIVAALTGLRWLFYGVLTGLWVVQGGWRPTHFVFAWLIWIGSGGVLGLLGSFFRWHWIPHNSATADNRS